MYGHLDLWWDTQDTAVSYTRYGRFIHKIRPFHTQDTAVSYTRYGRFIHKIRPLFLWMYSSHVPILDSSHIPAAPFTYQQSDTKATHAYEKTHTTEIPSEFILIYAYLVFVGTLCVCGYLHVDGCGHIRSVYGRRCVDYRAVVLPQTQA